jgi:HK97 gp10 family phage protein
VAKVLGLGQRKRRLTRMSDRKASQRRLQALYAAGQQIELDAEISITAGSVSGKDHQPSLPGQPPNADTRLLDTSIETTIERGNQVHVTSNAPYSAALEFGTSKMEERPFMRPAVERNRDSISRRMARLQAELSGRG